tara:strand:- start:23 stop:841 length:819 start_codon:yes stop_codon:yes gene_type:complete
MAEVPKLSPMKEEFIRGSDMVSLMRGEWHKLYQIKKGLVGRDDLSNMFNVQLGTFTEDFNLQWAEKIYDYKFINKFQVSQTKQYGNITLQGSPDGMDKEHKVIIECKHTHSMNTMENMINYYMPQIQFYLYITQYKKCLLSVIFGNKWEAVEIDSSFAYQEKILQSIKMFWEHITHNKEPEGDEHGTNRIVIDKKITNKIPINSKTKRDVSQSNSFATNCNTYLENEEGYEKFVNAKKYLKEEIKPNESEIYNDKISVKRDKRGSIRIIKKG